ncbi:MAG: carbamoyl-phosphate synthase large subunit [Alphaproteobacteria bacterium]|nr:carbamoyl-phosphate synthase large subunit [Alphaproteobacteria bacterium]MCL2505072.1 carbamoyl-phosphate synthase large subunit [Alphaproteobacteria bacterium]
MPKRSDIKSICIIGAGPIIIGQACEFDYSGVQACKALKQDGFRIVLINSNPATIMTDPEMADATYIEPITPEVVAKILEKEKPDAILATMGGQTALNIAMELVKNGTLDRLGIELIGANYKAIEKAEDRLLFRDAMSNIGLACPKSIVVKDIKGMDEALKKIGLPAIIRPSFTLGGTGGGIAFNTDQFFEIVAGGLAASPIHEVLVEESVLGWKEYEMEVIRDNKDNAIIVCSIENIDPMGIHTGDSVTVAPAMTITDKEYRILRDASIAILREIGVNAGGSNVQFAANPSDGRIVVIEMNPRVSRSSALASKATGFPISKVASKLAVGYGLDELKNDMTGIISASFEPAIDYIVTKVPRFTFEKFPNTDATLSTAMKSVGEVMAIGRSWHESIQKALRGLEIGLSGFNELRFLAQADIKDVHAALASPTPERLLVIADALRKGMKAEEIASICKFDVWFIERIAEIIAAEEDIRKNGLPSEKSKMQMIKKMGFSDARLSQILKISESEVAEQRWAMSIRPVFKRIDTCAAEFPSYISYLYSTYEGNGIIEAQCEANPSDKKKVIVLGGGPNRIGQGIEFDYCCVHAVMALRDMDFETIMINCNPETVSTDYDTADRLYFEPLTAEDVLEIIHKEQERGDLLGVIVQLGGQTPLKLAKALQKANIPLLGTSPDAIDLAEDRDRFQTLLKKLNLKQPPGGIVHTMEEAVKAAKEIGFPVVVRPSYVLGGRAMEIVHTEENLQKYMQKAIYISAGNPILIDHYLQDAIEVDVDVVSDGSDVWVAGIMEHIEEAGIHSGDSSCTLPPHSLSQNIIKELSRQAEVLAKEIKVIGLMNVQFAVKDGEIYILEVNPRASRTVPFVAKAIGIPVVKIATEVMMGKKLKDIEIIKQKRDFNKHMSVKSPVFPFAKFSKVDVILGPEMKSTGEVMGIDANFAKAYAKAQMGAGIKLPTKGACLISVKDKDKKAAISLARKLKELGFVIKATDGTAKTLQEAGIEAERINKVLQGSPHIVDAVINGEINMMINTTSGGAKMFSDSLSLRRTALLRGIPNYTTIPGAKAAIEAITALQEGSFEVTPIQKM